MKDSIRSPDEIELARLAAEFYATPESVEERKERLDWEALGFEVLKRNEYENDMRCPA